ncbi:MAG: AAA family ATPase [Methylobacter sp.]|nr:AAA family ATPase [Methylobacter sp.]MDP2099624.1 AAA family ATPase [Methylobacter sp.]MDP2429820.1 AAA family ATPase [Methylobacter sp.]MDP3055540.1 AAA family ATPase [Methylobacter sp.]MDP3361346.1 AAA family ATPase [Methylobacter sp.]
MAKIEGIRVKNFRALKDVTLGRLWNQQKSEPLTPMTVVIGKNGVGKSTLFDVFGFLADALKFGVEEACDLRGRGGFKKIRSQGQTGAIEFEIYYKENGNARPITYELSIEADDSGRPFVQKERLRQRRENQTRGWPFSFLVLNNGKGLVWKGEGKKIEEDKKEFDLDDFLKLLEEEESKETESVELTDKRRLGIATLGSLKQHPRISVFRQFIEGWYLSYFTPDAARSLPLAGPQKHLNIHGDNLGNVVQFMEREQQARFQKVLDRIAKKIPGINKIDTEKTGDDRLLLRFNDKGFQDPFYAQQMSDSTLKVFAYLLLLEDPVPPPFLCVEEPENGLYHKLLETLAMEFREHATGRKGGSQVFITTHQPYFVDALEPNEVWILEKGADGFSIIRRASDDALVKDMVAEGLPLGGLWYSDYLDAR